jgi:hypothetical protein
MWALASTVIDDPVTRRIYRGSTSQGQLLIQIVPAGASAVHRVSVRASDGDLVDSDPFLVTIVDFL